ncbi:MAG: hypothetical protein JNJ54_03500 [Myxococcaceae bacterium]|nr:hypothetical protein [Myxococcaceae bacterium]
MSQTLKALPVDLAELCIALEADSETSELKWFLDLESGRVILVSREYDANEWGGLQPEEIEGNPARFKPVPPPEPNHQLADMQAFVAALGDARLKESLELALTAPRPERRFRAVLGWLPAELEKWHAFRQQRCEARAHSWLSTVGVAATKS